MLKNVAVLFVGCALTACSGVSPGQYESYNNKLGFIQNQQDNANAISLKKMEVLKEITIARENAEKEIKLKEIECKSSTCGTQNYGNYGSGLSLEHCIKYKDEYPELYGQCLEMELDRRGEGEVAGIVPAVSGDNNVITVGSTGTTVSQGKVDYSDDPITSALLHGIDSPELFIPQTPVAENSAKPWIDGAVSLGKAALYTVIGYKAFGELGSVLQAGAARDSVGGDIISNSNNPVTTTTYPAEVAPLQ